MSPFSEEITALLGLRDLDDRVARLREAMRGDVRWAAGMTALVVEHDDDTRERKPGGQVFPASVTYSHGDYVTAEYTDGNGCKVTATFYADGGWAAFDGEYRWRLLPACLCGISGPGEVIPAACAVHGVPCETCGGVEECKPGCGETAGPGEVDGEGSDLD